MAELPAGTVSLLFTDIEGSTRRWEERPDAMRVALARHDAILRERFAAHGGHVFKTVGDAFCVAFSTPVEALAASAEAQRALAAEAWGPIGPLRVRMAIHAGPVEARDGDYFGPPLNRVARLLAAGHGGQVLLSLAARALVGEQLPPGASLRDLGEHRLKDLQSRERIFQLIVEGLPADFPPLRTLEGLSTNLPTQLTSFVGRESEMAEVERLLSTVRLLTLVGAGGAGKTRLAQQVAAGLLERYPDGVWLVELAALADPGLVPQAVASALSVRDDTGRPLPAVLAEQLRGRQLLLLLDNCEHLVGACAELAEGLLRACPELRILATSREALGIPGETTWRVPSLSLPDPRRLPLPAQLSAYEAIRLFLDRAAGARPGFALTDQNAPAVAQICQRLDGIPLAIELAAARMKVLTAEQIAARLDDRFRLLTAGSRTVLPRQQTLRALVDWSHDLLAEPERALFRRLSVFAGGWTLEAAEAICAGDGIEAYEPLDLLAELVDKSLVQVDEQHGVARYRLLETLRQYGAEQLRAAGEMERLRHRHRDWFLAFAERQAARLNGLAQADAFARLEAEHDNLRAALDWCETEAGGWEVAGRLADELGWFWVMRGYIPEARERLRRILSLATERSSGRARALSQAGKLAHAAGEFQAAAAHFEASLALWRELGDVGGAATALARYGQLEQSRGDFERAWTLLEESRRLFEAVGGESGLDAPVAVFLAQVAKNRGDFERASALFEECLALTRERGDRHAESSVLRSLGELALLRGDRQRAASRLRESLLLIRELDDRPCAVTTLDSLAVLAAARGEPVLAARLFGAAEASRATQGLRLAPADLERLDHVVGEVRAELGPAAFEAAWSAGQALPLEQAVAEALGEAAGG